MGASAKTQAADAMTMDRLASFGAARRAGDVDRLMSFKDAYRKVHGDITQSAPGR